MACCAAALGVVSCDDDAPEGLSEKEKTAAFNSVKGNYDGRLIYSAINPKDKKDTADTLSVSWTIDGVSTMTIKNFPVKLLAMGVNDTTLRRTLSSLPAQGIKCAIAFTRLSPVAFAIAPQAVTTNVAYNGSQRKVQIAFYEGGNSFAIVNAKRKLLQMQIIEGGIFLDGKLQKGLLSGSAAFLLEADKK